MCKDAVLPRRRGPCTAGAEEADPARHPHDRIVREHARGLASLISSVVAPETVYLALVSVAGFAVVGVWMSITASHFFHRRAFVRNGGDVAALAYRAPLFPVVPILAFALCLISLVGIALDPAQVAALYFGVPFVAACYGYFFIRYGRRSSGPATA
ncbi:hypothetical protein NG819_19335 [Pseudarthrobacter sp. Fe7]|nr:hypothetical protein NG819_19335 [Pseudarthrobacter sp. Fe7]